MQSSGSKFTSTKEISFASGLSIYQTRYTLIKLYEKGLVLREKIEHKHRKQWALNHCIDSCHAVSNDDMYKKISNQY
ncbi:FaeA/PapI family transcriptional regulator [Klebsiella aerogenes]